MHAVAKDVYDISNEAYLCIFRSKSPFLLSASNFCWEFRAYYTDGQAQEGILSSTQYTGEGVGLIGS